MIPLFQVKNSELTSLNGTKSQFYSLTPSDIEGEPAESKRKIFESLESSLCDLESDLKLYCIDGKLYLNTFGAFDLNYAQIVKEDNPLQHFGANVSFYEDYFLEDLKFKRILSVKEFPTKIDMLDSKLWGDFVINIQKIERTKAKAKVNMKRKIHYSNLFKGIKDIESENAYNEAESLLDDLSVGERALFNIEMFFILSESTKAELDEQTQGLIDYFKSIDGKLFVEQKGLSFFYKSLIPGVEASFKRSDLCPSDYLSYLIPFHSDMVHLSGMTLKSRAHNDIHLDIFDKAALNYNLLITGASGQGKSMIANKVLASELKEGSKGIVLDLGNSFKKTTEFYSGVVLSEKFNPLQFKEPRYLKEFILSAIDEPFSKKDEGRLFEEISTILRDGMVYSFGELVERLEVQFEGISYYFSELKDFFSDEVLELNDLTYCDFSNYPESMKAPLIIYLIEYFKNLEGKKLFIFDECWHLLNRNALYIAECFRTFRKYNASAVAISQNLDDFSITQLGRVIIQNTYLKLMFKQSLSPSEFVDGHTIDLINSVQSKKGEYSEFLLLSEDYKKPIRFYPTCLEYELFTSDKSDNSKISTYLDRTKDILSFKEAIINFTMIKNPFWEYYNEK